MYAHFRGDGQAELSKAAGLVRSSTLTVIAGIGASLNACKALENLLCAQGVNAIAIEAGEMLHYRHDRYREAVFVLVSRSGESVEVVKLLSMLKGRVPVIGVTNEPDSALVRAADVVLDVRSLPDEMVAIQSYTGTLLTLFLLAMTANDALDAAYREVDALMVRMAPWIDSSLRAIRGWDSFLEGSPSIYALGRGPSVGSALQAALLFGEVSKAPAVGMAVATFRHGPIEVVDSGFKGLIFAASGRTRDLNLALARDLQRFGGTVRVIGAHEESDSELQWIETPPCSEGLAPLVEIIPVQVAAMRLAELKGIEVGSFRFAPKITTNEERIGS